MTKQELKQGYKKTEIGEIPEDWELVNITNNSSLKARIGWQGLTTSEYLREGDYFLVSGVDFKDGKIDWDNCFNVSEERYNQDLNIQLRKGDVLVTKDGTIGKVAYVDSLPKPTTLNSGVFVIRPKNNEYDSNYLFYILNSSYFIKFLNKLKAGSTISHLYQKDFVSLNLILPKNINEQKSIAETLSKVDELIEKVELLIKKRKEIKKGVMQELLTGKTRIKGFNEEWKKHSLLELSQNPVTDGPHLTPKFLDDGIPFLSVDNIVNQKINFSKLRYISEEDHREFSKKCKPKKGDILLGKAATVGTVAIVETDLEFNIWSPLALIRINKNNDPKFIYYYFQTPKLSKQIKWFTNSSSQGNIGMRDIEKLEFLVPSKEEQTAIANVLSDMDLEIENLERKRDKCKMLKEGMMQQLLTGKIRLKWKK